MKVVFMELPLSGAVIFGPVRSDRFGTAKITF